MRGKTLFFSYLVIVVLGVSFHFLYDVFDIYYLKAIFPCNESIFEHLKLIVFPILFFLPFDLLFLKEKDIFPSYVSGILVSMLFTITGYYTYSGIVGNNIDFVNIGLYFIAIALFFYYRIKKITLFDGANSVIVLFVILVFIEVFTFYTPNIAFFNN